MSSVAHTQVPAREQLLEQIDELAPTDGDDLPRRFGAYRLLARLGRGGMGDVYLARVGDVGLARTCVVKTLRPHLNNDREYVARFLDEARVVVQLAHKNLCHVFDAGRVAHADETPRYYLAMEHVAGLDVRTLAEAAPAPLPPGLVVHVIGEVAEALHHAHERCDEASGTALRLVHRDVSPQNIMLSFAGEVKLIDFGLASSTLKLEQTAPQVVMGKLAYMAPEHVRGEALTQAADQFALAVVAYELFTGQRFYDLLSGYQVWTEATTGGHRPAGFSQLPAEVQAVLDRALSREAPARFPSCLAFREALMKVASDQGWRGDGPLLAQHLEQHAADHQRAHTLLLQHSLALDTTLVSEPAPTTLPLSTPGIVSTPPTTVAATTTVAPTTGWLGWPLFVMAAGVMMSLALMPPPPSPTVAQIPGASAASPSLQAAVAPASDQRSDAPAPAPAPAPAADTNPAEVATVPTDTTKRTPAKTLAEMTRSQRLQWLQRTCGALSCSEPLRQRFKTFGALSSRAMLRFDEDLQRCISACQTP
jgi:serine/threonine protein kinase